LVYLKKSGQACNLYQRRFLPVIVAFIVRGVPKSKGSYAQGRRKDGGTFVRPASPATKKWEKLVKEEAKKIMGHETRARPPLSGPVKVTARFFMPRPKNHYDSKGKLKWWSPMYSAVRPDLDKLERALNDGLMPYVLSDDGQIVAHDTCKVYVLEGQEPHVSIEIRELA
jgi:Holliday junction resolvase RusA-like endonuclease